MEICIIRKTQKINIYKNWKSICTRTEMFLAHYTIQILSCVMGYVNAKKNEKLGKKIDPQLCGSLK